MVNTITVQSVNQADQDNSLFFRNFLWFFRNSEKKKLFPLEISQKTTIPTNIDMEYYTKQRSIQPSFVSTANSMKQCFLFWYNYSRLCGRITAWRASLGRSCLPQTVVIEFVGNQLQLGIIYDSISCGEWGKRHAFPYTRLHQFYTRRRFRWV